jgi:hypothetical protein
MEHPDIAMGIRSRAADPTEQGLLRHDGKTGVHFEQRQNPRGG